MIMRLPISSVFITVFVLLSASLANADAVHKWVDENGVTHYSDEMPLDVVEEVEQITIPVSYASKIDAQNDYYSIANQWMRVHEQRIALEKIKLEKAKQKAESRAQESPFIVVNEVDQGGVFIPRRRFVDRVPYYGVNYHHKYPGKYQGNSYKLPAKHHRSIAHKYYNKRDSDHAHRKGVALKNPQRKAFNTR